MHQLYMQDVKGKLKISAYRTANGLIQYRYYVPIGINRNKIRITPNISHIEYLDMITANILYLPYRPKELYMSQLHFKSSPTCEYLSLIHI